MCPRVLIHPFWQRFVACDHHSFFLKLLASICLLVMSVEPSMALNAPSLQFPEISNHVITDKPFNIDVITNSNLAVEFSSLTPLTCSVSEKTVTLKNLGLCTISAKQISTRKISTRTSYQSFYINNAIAAGYFHNLRITADGNLYAWGNNSNGQLGNGSEEQKRAPTLVNLPAGVKALAVATGTSHSLAIGSDGKVYAWGNNSFGQLGDGTTESRLLPVVVSLPEGATPLSISAGAYHSLAIDKDGTLYSWGSNSDGQLGTGSKVSHQGIPVAITLPNMAYPVAIAAGQLHSLAIGSDNKLYAWGDNHSGQLGYGSTVSFNRPVLVKLNNNVYPISISAGANHSIVLTNNGDIFAWGCNFAGQLGDNTELDRNYPVKVALPLGVNIVSISAGANHSTAITENGELYAWGFNMFGQLGDGTQINRNSPIKVGATDDIGTVSVAVAGAMHSMLLNSNSKVFAWGGNGLGQLGITY